MRGALLALLLLAPAAWAQTQVLETASGTPSGTPGTYDPCLPAPTGVKRGDPFVVGLAFWPGGTVADWGAPYNETSGAPGLNPCLDLPVTGTDGTSLGNYQSYLSSKGVIFGTYLVKVDTLAGLRATRMEMDQVWRRVLKEVAAPEKQVMSVVAFRGQNRSEAQYVTSASAAASEGTGIVKELSLLVGWDRGTFAGFTWFNNGPCDACGGLSSGTCIQTQYDQYTQKWPQSTCAWTFDECACDADLARAMRCPSNNCTSVMYVAHRGSDAPGKTMESGYQIEQINQFSVTSFFWKILDGAFNLISNVGIGTPGSGTVSSTPAPPAAEAGTDAALAASQAGAAQAVVNAGPGGAVPAATVPTDQTAPAVVEAGPVNTVAPADPAAAAGGVAAPANGVAVDPVPPADPAAAVAADPAAAAAAQPAATGA